MPDGRRNMPSKVRIVDYWIQWQIANNHSEPPFGWFDWGEPACMACTRPWTDMDGVDIKPRHTDKSDTWHIARKWADAPFDRCHVLARAFGGEDDPSNLVLLCLFCHRLQPDDDRKKAFQWMREMPPIWALPDYLALQEERPDQHA